MPPCLSATIVLTSPVTRDFDIHSLDAHVTTKIANLEDKRFQSHDTTPDSRRNVIDRTYLPTQVP